MVFCNGISCLCGCWVRLNTHTNCIFYSKTIKNGFLNWNIVFLWLLSGGNTHTNRISLRKTLKMCFLMEYRVCVAVDSTQYPHTSYTPLQNGKEIVFFDRKSCLCVSWVRFNTQKNRIFHCKMLKQCVLKLNIVFV